MGRSANRRGELRVDQVLHPRPQEPTEQVLGVTIAETADQIGNSGIIVMGHRVVPSQ